ncbi:DUF928 domain-containing protein [Leptothoe kymatousa]|uniref:DUF928 domain-containing protein n=1 Tax=Leptothoe kymatousa TAU-MAC 1615 TaxID=2364775 RepID=A0ABS5Y832_9CYAN|nr:DUF928 domain-containing protein [Leptothoe kymatousa]MBT9313663.1 DUF928 domain-containing protein [Leptothoe kymatousa TAU-MAC 1615]
MKLSPVIFALWSSVLLCPCLSPLSVAQAQQSTIDTPSYNYSAPILASLGSPPGRRGSATRNETPPACVPSTPLDLTALVPRTREPLVSDTLGQLNNKDYESVLSVTTQESPRFWFYVPNFPDSVSFEFVLQDDQENTLYESTLATSTEGIIQFTLPGDVPIQVNKLYTWSLVANCDPVNPPFVYGSIARVTVDPSVDLSLAEATPKEQAAIYASNGLWQDAITLLGELYQSAPNDPDIANAWTNLLSSVNLAEVAEQPMPNCCTQ